MSLPGLDSLDKEALKALLIRERRSNAERIEHLKLTIEKLRRQLFGAKSEKVAAELEQLQLELDELETVQTCRLETDATPTAEAPVKSRPFRKPLPEHLPREVVTYDPEQSCCPDCGGALKPFGEDVSEQLERIPATFKVIRHVRPKFACARCERVVQALGVVKELTQIADTQKSRLVLSYARDVHVDDFKEANVVLIGASVANPWIELFEPKMNFVFTNAHIRQYIVVNRTPTGTEPAKWTANYDDPQHRVYGVVGFLPNLGGNGNALILEGTSMAGTQCAWDFVADDSSFLPFINRIKRADGSIPHFQLVLESTNLTCSAIKRDILAWRVME